MSNTTSQKGNKRSFIYIYYKLLVKISFRVFHSERLTTLCNSTTRRQSNLSSFLFSRISESNFFFKLSNQIVKPMNPMYFVSRTREECKTALWTKKGSIRSIEILNTTSHSCWLQTSFLSLLGTTRSFYHCSLPYHRVVPSF